MRTWDDLASAAGTCGIACKRASVDDVQSSTLLPPPAHHVAPIVTRPEVVLELRPEERGDLLVFLELGVFARDRRPGDREVRCARSRSRRAGGRERSGPLEIGDGEVFSGLDDGANGGGDRGSAFSRRLTARTQDASIWSAQLTQAAVDYPTCSQAQQQNRTV